MVIGDAIRRSCANWPDKLAVKDEYGKYFPQGTSYSFREMGEMVNRLANSLLEIGLCKGDRVSVMTGTGLGHVLSLLALCKAGMIISPIDRTYMADEIEYQAGDAGSRGFIVDGDIYADKIAAVVGRLPDVDYFIGIGEDHSCPFDFSTLMAEGSSEEPSVTVSETDIATLVYTSGTTGRAKGVPLSHRAWLHSANVWAAELKLHPYTRALLPMPLHTSGGTGQSLIWANRGYSLFLSDPQPAKLLETINKEKITFFQASPTLLANVIRHPDVRNTDFSHIETWFTSAAPISAELLAEGASYLGKKFTQLYGTTETALLGTVLRPEDVDLEGPKRTRLASVGKACMGYETKVIKEDGGEAGPGEMGELAVRGPAVAMGYWNKAEADDFKDGWWYSGDLVRLDDEGFYFVVDRKKDMILSGGTNIYPMEIEAVIAKHPAVHLVCVVGVPDPKWGESVKAVVVLRPDMAASEEEIIDFCRERMASYKKPKSVDFVSIEEMPLMGGGYKVLRRELRDRYRRRCEAEQQDQVQSWGAAI